MSHFFQDLENSKHSNEEFEGYDFWSYTSKEEKKKKKKRDEFYAELEKDSIKKKEEEEEENRLYEILHGIDSNERIRRQHEMEKKKLNEIFKRMDEEQFQKEINKSRYAHLGGNKSHKRKHSHKKYKTKRRKSYFM
jgi:hypothetical protein